jgi:inhibitor of KinA sporulation pathway (predicted exonuclease)
MSIRRDFVVIVDIEATCWKKNPPSGEQNEIIEIGVCTLDLKSLQRDKKRSIFIKPTRSKVSPFCTSLTSLTQEMVDEGITYAEACHVLEEDYATKSHLWVSWGSYDRKMFQQQAESFAVPYPFAESHLDLKRLFASVQNGGKKVGMARALKISDIPLEGMHHRGHDDAWNIAMILATLIKQHGRDMLLPYW